MKNTLVVCTSCGAKNRVPVDKLQQGPKCGRCGESLTGAPVTGMVIEITDSNFSQVVEQSPIPVLVDFYSPTCGPCQMVAPLIENVAENFAGKAVVGKLNTAVQSAAPARFQIRGVPTLIYFKNGQLVDQMVGAGSQADIEARLRNIL